MKAPSPHPLPQAWGRGKGEGELKDVKRIIAFVLIPSSTHFIFSPEKRPEEIQRYREKGRGISFG